MAFTQSALPYDLGALKPHISAETLEYHYGKHHKAYVTKLNELVAGTPFEKMTLAEVIQRSEGPIFNNAAQAWNHSFYWSCLSPKGGGAPTGALATAINKEFGDFETFQKKFTESAKTKFGSGWTWLIQHPNGRLAITNTDDAKTPMVLNQKALLTCDVWEHAYYIDYRNARDAYIDAFWKVVNWEFANLNMAT